eukprot:2666368-Amphidinium_carterae.1
MPAGQASTQLVRQLPHASSSVTPFASEGNRAMKPSLGLYERSDGVACKYEKMRSSCVSWVAACVSGHAEVPVLSN